MRADSTLCPTLRRVNNCHLSFLSFYCQISYYNFCCCSIILQYIYAGRIWHLATTILSWRGKRWYCLQLPYAKIFWYFRCFCRKTIFNLPGHLLGVLFCQHARQLRKRQGKMDSRGVFTSSITVLTKTIALSSPFKLFRLGIMPPLVLLCWLALRWLEKACIAKKKFHPVVFLLEGRADICKPENMP